MATHLRFDTPHVADTRRYAIGVLVSSGCDRVAAALIGVTDRGIDLRVEVAGVASEPVPAETTAAFRQLSAGPAARSGSRVPELIVRSRTQLAEIQASLVDGLPVQADVAQGRVLAVGVHDPALWTGPSCTGSSWKGPSWKGAKDFPLGFIGLSDAARLAELTGLNVVDAFAARDLAQGGQGGPLTALPEWIILKDPGRCRLLLDLGQTTRMTYLPADCGPAAASRILAFEVGPGMRLLDLITKRLTGGEHAFDPGGRLAVQGRRINELLEHWLADPYFQRSLPRWHPRGVRPERFLTDALRMAVDSGWSVRDLLCTATHFVAETIGRAVRRRLPDDAPIHQVLLVGGGQHNGMLLREIAARLEGIELLPINEVGISGEPLGPASIAVLAMLHLDQVPANQPAVTGADVSRGLGRLTPGSPLNWQRLLRQLTGSAASLRPLRNAL